MFLPLRRTVDELPVFENLWKEEPFRQYARDERYQIAQQAQIEAAGFVF